MSEIIHASRKRADGSLLRWKMLFMKQADENDLPWPFFIQWEMNDSQRLIDLKKQNILKQNQENIHVKAIQFIVKNVEEKANKWKKAFQMIDHPIELNRELKVKQKKLTLDGVDFIFMAPLEESIYSTCLKKRGERPVGIQFTESLFQQPTLYLGSYYY